MTPEQHAARTTLLRRRITLAKSEVVKAPTLADKVAARAKQRELEEQLREHQLNFFELVPSSERRNLDLNQMIAAVF
jgi:hypothetical protein